MTYWKNKLVYVAVTLVLVAEPWLFWGYFAGDAEIHLVFARQAAAGNFFHFNSGEVVAGETSVGYMLLLAGFYKTLPEAMVPIAVKIFGYAAWYAFLAVYYCLARALLRHQAKSYWPFLCVAIVGLMPGSIYNAVVGMENALFALLLTLWLFFAQRWAWFESTTLRLHQRLWLIILATLFCWVRPEGGVVVGILFLTAVWRRKTHFHLYDGLEGVLLVIAVVSPYLFHHHYTGLWLPTSAVARAILSHQTAWEIGSRYVDPKVVQRLFYYAPLTLCWLWGLSRCRGSNPETYIWRALAVLPPTFFLLYSTVLSTAHLGRYLLCIWPMLVLFVPFGVAQLHRRGGTIGVGLACGWMLAVFGVELHARSDLGSPHALSGVVSGIQHRQRNSDRMLRYLGTGPTHIPVTLAYQAVHMRNRYDDRFIIRSLDGRTDPLLLKFVHKGYYDHIGYLNARRVNFLMETPNYNRDGSHWSLAELRRLKIGQSLTQHGLTFTAIADGKIYRITR